MSRINLKELIEELEAIKKYNYRSMSPHYNDDTIIKEMVDMPVLMLEKVIQELKQLENIYNQ